MTTGGGITATVKLSPIEERGLQVWGKVCSTGTPGIQVTGGLQHLTAKEDNTFQGKVEGIEFEERSASPVPSFSSSPEKSPESSCNNGIHNRPSLQETDGSSNTKPVQETGCSSKAAKKPVQEISSKGRVYSKGW